MGGGGGGVGGGGGGVGRAIWCFSISGCKGVTWAEGGGVSSICESVFLSEINYSSNFLIYSYSSNIFNSFSDNYLFSFCTYSLSDNSLISKSFYNN